MRMFWWLLAAAGLTHAQYFPLHVGDQWIYRVEEGPAKEVRVAEITLAETIDGREYFVYKGLFGDPVRIRLTDGNQLVQWNAGGTESLWADFEMEEGGTYPVSFDACTGRGRVETRNVTAESMGRTWGGGIRVRYSAGSCADAGVTEDLYLPGLGLAERTYQSIAGPRRFRLTYARIGNASVVTSGEYSFRIHLDRKTYPPRAAIHVRMTLENSTNEPILLHFTSGQSFDFSIRDAAGEIVYVWSANKSFTAELRDVAVTGEKNWTVTEELDLKPGEYVMEAWLTAGRVPVFKAQVPIAVTVGEPAK